MKKVIIYLTILFLSFNFFGCSSKSQTEVIVSGSKDISELLKTLIQKEKEINELNKQLEDSKNSKVKK